MPIKTSRNPVYNGLRGPLRRAHRLAVAACIPALLEPGLAVASLFKGEALDTMADVLTWIVLIFVPVAVIVLFWLVHILPEKIAEKRHHPQKESIKVLCLLSLVFGGMLWPIAWLWAYTRPVMHKMAYGTDKHEEYFVEAAEKARGGGMLREELKNLVEELEGMEARGALPAKLTGLKDELARLRDEAAAERAAVEDAHRSAA